jgi:Trypsin
VSNPLSSWAGRIKRLLPIAAFAAPVAAFAIMAGSRPDSPEARIDPNNAASPWGGVGSVIIGDGVFSGALVHRRFVLTAAHVVGSAEAGGVAFVLNASGDKSSRIAARRIHVHPLYKGFVKPFPLYDAALIELEHDAPADAPVYDMYFGSLRAGTVLTFVGYGASGFGDEGPSLPSNGTIKRSGQNTADKFVGLADDPKRQAIFLYDFDGSRANTNVMGARGLGNAVETSAAVGDSGAPAFIVRGEFRELVGVLTFVGDFIRPGAPASIFGAGGGGILLGPLQGWLRDVIAGRYSQGH